MDLNTNYEFNLTEKTLHNYKCSKNIIQWLKNNLESLTDDNNRKIFSKVNHGYNAETLKSFGKKPVCDVYINSISYDSDLIENNPNKVTSFIISYLKGNMNNSYLKGCELTDYIIQEFSMDNAFRELEGVVKYTTIQNVEIQIVPSGKTYGVLCAFELEHELY